MIKNWRFTLLTVFKYAVVLSILTLLCNVSLGLVHVAELKLYTHWTTLHMPLHLLPGNHHSTIVFSVFMTLTTFDVSYKWNHTDLSLWCLAYFTQHNVLKVHPFCSMCQDLLFWLNNIPLYIFTTFSLSVYLSVDIWAASISWLLWVMLQYMWVYIEIW